MLVTSPLALKLYGTLRECFVTPATGVYAASVASFNVIQ